MPRKLHGSKSETDEKPQKAARATVSREVANLGRQVAETIKAVAQSDELREVGTEIANSLGRVSDKLVNAVKTAGKSERPREVAQQFGKIVDTGRKRGMQAGETMRQNLATGLREIGQELSRLAERLNK